MPRSSFQLHHPPHRPSSPHRASLGIAPRLTALSTLLRHHTPHPRVGSALTRALWLTFAMPVLLAGLALAPIARTVTPTDAPVAHAASANWTFQLGYSVQHGWLCYGFHSGSQTVLHCTQHYLVSGGRYISLTPGWVPSEGTPTKTVATAGEHEPDGDADDAHSTATVATHATTTPLYGPPGDFCRAQPRTVPANVSQWMVPTGCISGIFSPNPANYAPHPSFGWCNWWPEALRNVNNPRAGSAHSAPRVGATVFFAPGDQGASSAGHFAYVEQVGSNGWLLISEMNMYWRGSGFAKVSFRYVRVDSGTTFYY